MREPPLLSRRWPGGTVLTSSGAVVAGCAAVTEKDADSGCCRPFTLTVMVPTDPACQHPPSRLSTAETSRLHGSPWGVRDRVRRAEDAPSLL